MVEYAGKELIPKEIANKRIVELYEELWYYNIGKSKYTELALIERKHETFLEAIQDGKNPVHCIIIEEIVGYIVELKIADGIRRLLVERKKQHAKLKAKLEID